jgi:hypothetical protein
MTPNKSPEPTGIGRFFFIHKSFSYATSQVAGGSAFSLGGLHTSPIMNTKTKPCRNCGGTQFYTGEAARTVAITLTSLPPKFNLRVCGDCGLLDWFLPDKYLQKVRKKFSPEQV